MNSKIKAIRAAFLAGFAALCTGVNIVPNSLKDSFIRALQQCFPETWRPEIVAIGGLVTVMAAVYAVVHAANSDSFTPPNK